MCTLIFVTPNLGYVRLSCGWLSWSVDKNHHVAYLNHNIGNCVPIFPKDNWSLSTLQAIIYLKSPVIIQLVLK